MCRFALLLFVSFSLQALGADAVLENVYVRFAVSPQNGSIVSILHKPSGTEYIADPARANLFRFLIPTPEYLARRIDSTEQKVESVSVDGGTLTIRFQNLQISKTKYIFQVGPVQVPEPALPMTVTVSFRLEVDHVLGNIAVDNRSLEEITDVTFPWITSLSRGADPKQVKIVLPSLSNKQFTATSNFILGERGQRYPGLLAAPWVSYETAGGGIGLDVRSSLQTQDALIALTPNMMSPSSPSYWGQPDIPYIGWSFYPHIGGQDRWQSPDVVIHVHHPGWQNIASEHREWYRKQYPPKANAAFRNRIGFATYRFKDDASTIHWTYAQLPQLAQAAKAAGMDRLVLLNWREREGTANPSPFAETADPRLGGAAALRNVIQTLHQQGTELVFAFHPTLINTAPEKYQEQVLLWTVKSRRQANQIQPWHTFITLDYPYEDTVSHYWAAIDPSSKATEYLLSEARRMKEQYGFRNLFLRGVGLFSFLSYNTETASPPQKAFVEGYEKFLGGISKAFPDGLIMMEGFNELVNPYSSAGYTWSQSEMPEVLALSVPWVPFSNDVEALEYEQANASFARKVLINLVVDGGESTVIRYKQFAEHLNSLQRLKTATLPYYAEAEFRDHEGLSEFKPDASVIVSSFENLAGRQFGVVIANLAAGPKQASFRVARKGIRPSATLVRADGRRQRVSLAGSFGISLAPYEVAVLCIDSQ